MIKIKRPSQLCRWVPLDKYPCAKVSVIFFRFFASFGRHCVNISGMVIKIKREMTYQLSDCGILGRRWIIQAVGSPRLGNGRHQSQSEINKKWVIYQHTLTLPMLWLFSSKAQEQKDLWDPSKPCHFGIYWIALTEYSQMSTHVPGFQSFFRGFALFCISQISQQQHT